MHALRISNNPADFDIDLIHAYLSEHTDWAKNIPKPLVEKSIRNSLCFAGLMGNKQIAFARVISDYATFAYLGDVFVLPEHRGSGHSKALIAAVLAHPELQGLRRFSLATSDAHALYSRFGFAAPHNPQFFMERHFPNMYS